MPRGYSGYGLSQWEMTLQCNVISHWLSPCPEWSLILLMSVMSMNLLYSFDMAYFQVGLDITSCILSIHSLFHVLVSQNGCWKIWPTFAGLRIFWANLICTIVAGSMFHHVSAGAIMCWQYELGNVTISRSNIVFHNYLGMNAWGPCWW